MFDSVLGIDPGVASLGLAVLARDGAERTLVWSGTLQTPSDLAEALRLARVYRAVARAIETHQPGCVAIERLAWNRNVTSGMVVARASGAVLVAAAQAGLEVFEYGSREVKMAATGDGAASKEQVRDALRRFHKIAGVPDQPDAADAVAVALCHLTGAAVRASAELAQQVRA